MRSAVNDGLIAVDDVVEMSRGEDGKLRVQQGSSGTAAIATGGAVVGGLIGLLFMAPLFGMAVGAVTTGGMWSTMCGDAHVSKKFVRNSVRT
ncbi:DUF1269 domain-containing protein [Actinopolymorpha singaporensis]|uniref:DUF1269 domain-containing protein n=1 Tax=Actinopolymorpha singaporensis TaxID=117157 RepID=UPI001A7E1006|nr:DUF1269 domain-containing protein [Actinopolymorpha singaporensis]